MNRKEHKEVPPKHISDKIQIRKLLPDAKFPYREEGRDHDVGMNIELMARTDNRSDDVFSDVNEFRTGLGINPPEGHYIEVIANEELHRHGYMLASSVKIINPGCTEELKIPLYKFKDSEDLELPFVAVKMIVKPAVYAHPKSVKSISSNGESSFGSSSFEGYGMGSGMYIPDPRNASYGGDMNAYQQQVSSYSKGMRRPAAAPTRSNHMF